MKHAFQDIVLVHHDLGASLPGARKGPALIWNKVRHLFKNSTVQEVHQHTNFDQNTPFAHARHIDKIHHTLDTLSEIIKANIQRNQKSCVLAGDHSTAAGTVAGIKKAYPDKRLGVVWFDAHADIHSPHTSPSGNLHGMPLGIITDQDNTLRRIREITMDEHNAWEALQSLSIITPAVLPCDIAFCGIRDLQQAEKDLIASQRSLNLYAHNLTSNDPQLYAAQILHHLADCDILYVSFDIDCLDAALVPGTGTPAEAGPSMELMVELCKLLVHHPKTVCFELAEYNPELDQNNTTLDLTAQIIETIFTQTS